jgi:hypothetical protein
VETPGAEENQNLWVESPQGFTLYCLVVLFWQEWRIPSEGFLMLNIDASFDVDGSVEVLLLLLLIRV